MRIEYSRIINDFIKPNKCQYSIPVYQRNYEWSRDQCRKLFYDIVEAFSKNKAHFCGTFVYVELETKNHIKYFVIVDGQQRLTSIYLLLKALIDCASTDDERKSLHKSIFNYDEYDNYSIDIATKLKLKPIKSDNNQLSLLMDNHYEDIDKSSGIWINYLLFKELVMELLKSDSEPKMSTNNIFEGLKKLICASIILDSKDNAQEIFERINSTGIPLNLADKIRNFVLMTEVEQEILYEQYWLKIESAVQKEYMSEFFLDYLNFRLDEFIKEDTAYDQFKKLFREKEYTNKSMLEELLHYADLYHLFMNGNKRNNKIDEYLFGLRQLKQSTVFLFLFHVFDDFQGYNGQKYIDEKELEKVLQLLLSYSVRRIMCEIPSNSLHGLYKTLYKRVFLKPENKAHYYDSIISFLQQMTSRDIMPTDDKFLYTLKHNNLYDKKSLCRYLLITIENQGKEKIQTENLSIEHIMPQNKDLSNDWQKMLGNNWSINRDQWLHTLGNLTLTGYNSELGDRPFNEKKEIIEKMQTRVVRLNKDVLNTDRWNAETIQKRADNLAQEVLKLFPVILPNELVSFNDPNYKEYTCAEPRSATSKIVKHYVLLEAQVTVNNFTEMVCSVARKLYERDCTVIERMARNLETFTGWTTPVFSYDESKIEGKKTKIQETDIYIRIGYSASKCIKFIRGLLEKYDLNIEEDFVYSAKEMSKK